MLDCQMYQFVKLYVLFVVLYFIPNIDATKGAQ